MKPLKNALFPMIALSLASAIPSFARAESFRAPASIEAAAVDNPCEELTRAIDDVIDLVVDLERYVTLNDTAKHLRPIKVLGGKTKAMIQGRGTLSAKSIASVRALITRIRRASDFVEARYHIDATFNLAISLDAKAEYLDDLID